MSTLGLPQLHQVSGAIENPSLASLKTANEAAPIVRMSACRVQELAQAQVLPHYRIDGGEPLFHIQSLKQYVRRYLTIEYEGAPLPLDLRPIVLAPTLKPVPIALASIQDRIVEYPAWEVPSCVYFLIENNRVAYIGQSRNLPSRLSQHEGDGKTWDRVLFIPLPPSDLLRVEAEWIAALAPPLNRAGIPR